VTTAIDSGAQGVRWDLTPLAPSEEAMKERLEAAVADAAAFVERWSAKSLETIEPAGLRALLHELAEIRAAGYEARQWVFALRMTDSENPAVLDIRAWVDTLSPRLDEAIRHAPASFDHLIERNDAIRKVGTEPKHEAHRKMGGGNLAELLGVVLAAEAGNADEGFGLDLLARFANLVCPPQHRQAYDRETGAPGGEQRERLQDEIGKLHRDPVAGLESELDE